MMHADDVPREPVPEVGGDPAPAGRDRQPLPCPSDWTFELIETYHAEIARVARDFGLDTYPVQLEVITAEQMIDAYASVGMPVNYRHWSFGKQFIATEKHYRRGQMGLAYEIVINSDPCINYIMEENSMTMQCLVLAHAAMGHNHFFKNNYLFKQWTQADAILEYLAFAKKFVADCEERFGVSAVESVIDAAHALMNQGVSRNASPRRRFDPAKAREREIKRREYEIEIYNEIWRTLPQAKVDPKADEPVADAGPLIVPEETLLYFLEKHAPKLAGWKREILRTEVQFELV